MERTYPPELKSKDIIGFSDNGNGFAIEDRIHIAIFGEVGAGKTETIKLLILQNILRGDGFLFLDPHGMAAREVIGMIPKERWDDVVYITPSSIIRYGKTIRINPLEVKDPNERYIISMSFVNSLRNFAMDAGSWGDRLEAILRNGSNALVEIKNSTLRDLRLLISDDKARNLLLSKVTSKDTIHFFKNTFEKQYSKEAGSAAYNKLDRILATPPIAAMLDSPTSSIDFGEIMDQRKIVIVDLSTGASDDLAAFLGSVILHMFYVEAKKRIEKTDEILKNPYYFYIDEAHRFAAFALREILNTMRKFGVKVTIATQTVDAYPKRVADEITALCRTVICFKCNANTAQEFKNILPVKVDEMASMAMRTFAFYSQAVNPVSGIAKTKKIDPSYDWHVLAKYSVQKYGEAVSLAKYMPILKEIGEYPQLIPCESLILHQINYNNRAMSREELYDVISQKFNKSDDDTKRLVFESCENLSRMRHLDRIIDNSQNRKEMKFKLTSLATNTFFSTTAMGRRAGSTLHLAAIFSISKMMAYSNKHCIIDLGDKGEQRADLLVFQPETFKDEQDRIRFDLENWSDDIIAVEVETDPTKHVNQIIINYQKNKSKNLNVWFAVFSEKHKEYIISALTEKQIPENEYSIMILNEELVLQSYEKYFSSSTTSLSELEAQVLSILGTNPGTTKTLSSLQVSTEAILEVLKSLEGKKLITTSELDIAKKTIGITNNRTIIRHSKKNVSELTPEGTVALAGPQKQDTILNVDELKKSYQEHPTEKLLEVLQNESTSPEERRNIGIVIDARLQEKPKTGYDTYSTDVLKAMLKDKPSQEEQLKIKVILESRGLLAYEDKEKNTFRFRQKNNKN